MLLTLAPGMRLGLVTDVGFTSRKKELHFTIFRFPMGGGKTVRSRKQLVVWGMFPVNQHPAVLADWLLGCFQLPCPGYLDCALSSMNLAC